MIEIDGTYHEGGGQIVRTALALSTLTGRPFRIVSIRKGRDRSGLKAQHLAALAALQEWTGAKAADAALGSEQLEFFPGKLPARTLSVDIGTAGSVTLLLQSLLLPALFADGRVRFRLTGGTDVQWSPPADYFMDVLLPHLRKFCGSIACKILRRGFYPQGGGQVEVVVRPLLQLSQFGSFAEFLQQLRQRVPPVNLSAQHTLAYVKGVSFASASLQQAEVAERQARAARLALSALDCSVQLRTEYANTPATGSGIALWAAFSENDEISAANPVILGGNALGEQGKRAEAVGRGAAEHLLHEISGGAAADAHLADQLIPFLALAGGRVRASAITPHVTANIYTAQKFLGKRFGVEGNVLTAT